MLVTCHIAGAAAKDTSRLVDVSPVQAAAHCVNHRALSGSAADRRCQDSKSLPLLYK